MNLLKKKEAGCQCIMQRQENNIYYAGFFVRLAAWAIDSLLVGVLLFIIKLPMIVATFGVTEGNLFKEVLFQLTVWDILFYILAKSYYVATTYCTGATVGKKLMNIKVVPAREDKITLWNILYRETIGKYLSDLFLCIGYIIVGIDKEKRGFHDMLSDTWVIYNLKRESNIQEEKIKVDSVKFNQKEEEEVQYKAAAYGYQSEQKRMDENRSEETLSEAEESEQNDENDIP